MPVVSHPPATQTIQPHINHLPDTAKSAVFQHADARAMDRLLGEPGWKDAFAQGDFERAARGLIQRMEREPLGSWPHWSEWQTLADKAGELRHTSAHAKLLANLWAGSMCLSTGLVTKDRAVYRETVADVQLHGGRLVQTPGRPPDLIARPRVPRDGARFVSADGRVHGERCLAGLDFTCNQMHRMCEVVDSTRTAAPARRWIVEDEAGSLFLYDPAGAQVVPLPDLPTDCTCAATSANGRYAAAASSNGVVLHDCEAGTTTRFEFPVECPWQLSVDSEGVVFIATPSKGLQFAARESPGQVDLARRYGNYCVGPGERTLVTSDATGNLCLVDRRDGASKTLLPAADHRDPARRNILSLASSPGLAWVATTCSTGTLSLYSLPGTEDDAKLEPAFHMPLRMQSASSWLQNAVAWFDPDGSAVNVGYTETSRNDAAAKTVQLMRLPLV